MSQFQWNVCLLKWRWGASVWRVRIGWTNHDETSGWHGSGHMRIAVFPVPAQSDPAQKGEQK